MKTILKNGSVVNVFIDAVEKADVLIEDGIIKGVGDYSGYAADEVIDITGKTVCPGLIDGHIHIESTMLTPAEFAKAVLPHGTTTVVIDPHEIANVSGVIGIGYMLEASEGLPVSMYVVLPSCVPATGFDENGAVLDAQSLKVFYKQPRVLGLGEMMNYPGILADVPDLYQKIADARAVGKLVNGHAPMLSGNDLDKYISCGIEDDHECSSLEEAKERIRKGQTIMIRQGSAARNLEALGGLFEEPWASHCILATDDRHPADLIADGHMDNIIRCAVKNGKSVLTAIRMATLQAARHFRLYDIGAVAPGYQADLLILDDLEEMKVCSVLKRGKIAAEAGKAVSFPIPQIQQDFRMPVLNSFYCDKITADRLRIEPKGSKCRVINVLKGELITKESIEEIDFSKNNGIDPQKDILKLAIVERHMNTGHIGLGFVKGLGIKRGAIATSVSHDSHNLIVVGTNDEDMCAAANAVLEKRGGSAAVLDGKVLARLELPVGGLMSLKSAEETAEQCRIINETVHNVLECAEGIEPFMNTAFISLPVIPDIKLTTLGLIDVNGQKIVPLFV